MKSFAYSAHPARVLFGSGTVDQVRTEVERLGCSRVLILGGRAVAKTADRIAAELGPLVVARFDGAVMHTPAAVTEQALSIVRDRGVDCLVAIGGGSTTGLSKALAYRTDLPQIVLPTTYAGSEVTPVLGETADGQKTTITSPAVLPETVVYDVDLTLGLPVGLTVTSGINALAHAVEALYSQQANPVIDALALDAITRISRALPAVAADPADPEARAELLHGAWLAGTCLGSVGMGLHHKLCHTLGGAFGLPHAETHTVVLPHAMAYNAPAVPQVMRRIAAALGGSIGVGVADGATDGPGDPTGDAGTPGAVFDLVVSLGGPTSLRELGLAEADLHRAAQLAAAKPYPNPRELDPAAIEALLRDAWTGRRPGPQVTRRSAAPAVAPAVSTPPEIRLLTEQVVTSFDQAPDPRLKELLAGLVRHLHGFAVEHDVTQREWQYAIDFLTRTGQISDENRQEFILLSDTLGVSSVVDVLENSRAPGATPSAVLGPFYVEGPPEESQGGDISGGLPGTPLWVDVRVVDAAGRPLADAVVDVWQSNEDGFYDVQLPDLDGPVLRARFRTDDAGRLVFRSILPSEYPIPQDGPVGTMLAAVNRHPYRAPHLHFMISAPGCRRLVTQLFVAGGKYLDSDTVFGVKEALVVDYARGTGPAPDGRADEGEWRLLDFTFHLASTGESA